MFRPTELLAVELHVVGVELGVGLVLVEVLVILEGELAGGFVCDAEMLDQVFALVLVDGQLF